jgi:hypothetical protein
LRRAQRDFTCHFKNNGNGNGNGNGICKVQYPKGIAPWSQTGMASSDRFLDRPMVQCPCGGIAP